MIFQTVVLIFIVVSCYNGHNKDDNSLKNYWQRRQFDKLFLFGEVSGNLDGLSFIFTFLNLFSKGFLFS